MHLKLIGFVVKCNYIDMFNIVVLIYCSTDVWTKYVWVTGIRRLSHKSLNI